MTIGQTRKTVSDSRAPYARSPDADTQPGSFQTSSPGTSSASDQAVAALQWSSLPRVSGERSLRQAIQRRQPVIVSDLAVDWPALHEWTPGKLRERYGDREVRVYDASFGAPGRGYMGSVDSMSFADFLEATQERGRDLRMFLYNLSRQIPELLEDIRLPDVGLRFSRRFVFSFFGCAGSTTPLHFDIDMGDVLHTVVRGQRRVRMFPPQSSALVYRHPFTVRSYVNLDTPDLARYPALERVEGFEMILQPGETLYMPAGWWHEYHYLDAGIGVSLRAPSPRWQDSLRGIGKLLLASPIDRVMNFIAPNGWYAWKDRRADRIAVSALRSLPAAPRQPFSPEPRIQD